MDNITKKYEISDFETPELCNLDVKESCRRAFFLRDKLNDILTSIESHIEVNVNIVLGVVNSETQVSFNDEDGIDCCVKIPSIDLSIAQFVQFAEDLGLDSDEVSMESKKDGLLLYWEIKKEDVLNTI